MMKRFFTICLLCLFLTGCGNKDKSVTNITFSTWGSASEMSILKPIISDFEKENPDIKVNLQHIPQNYFQKIHLLFASNLEPDVIFINNLNLPVYSNRLADLSDVIDKKTYFKQGVEALSVDGKVYAVPRDISVLMIYYNKDLFDICGVKYPSRDWTLADLENISKKLTNKNTFGISYEPDIYYALPYIGYFLNGANDVLQSDSKEFKDGISFYKGLAFKSHYAPTPSEVGSLTLAQMFLKQKTAMHLSGRWLTPKYRESSTFRWDVVNFPDCTAPSDASGWAISKASKHKKEALKFVLYLASKQNIEKMTADGLIIPARVDVANSPAFLSGKPEHSQLFLYAIEHSKTTKVDKKYNKTVNILNEKYFDK